MNRFGLIAVWVLQLVLAAFFAMQGAVKLADSQNWVSRFSGWGYPDRFYFVVGLVELSGAIILLIPKLARFGALLLMVVMVGATATHLIHHEPQVVTTSILLVLLGAVLYMRRGTIVATARE